MPNDFKGKECREFFRYRHEEPVRFKEVFCSKNKNINPRLSAAASKNLSVSGMLFACQHPPDLSSIIVLDIDYRTTRICEEIEENALILNNRLLGKVVRIEDNGDGSYDVGVAFIKKSDTLPEGVEALIK